MLAKHHAMVTILILSASGLFGCSPVMEATRPNPVDIAQLAVGESRAEAEAELGPPVSTITDWGKSCDIYKLYTHGLNGVEKGAIAVGEAAADVFTLGLAEVVLTPAEAATQNERHVVMLCYANDSDDAPLKTVRESGGATQGGGEVLESPSAAKAGGITAENDRMGEN
jgi:hypothetical protein